MKGRENFENPVVAQETEVEDNPVEAQQELAQKAIREQEKHAELQTALAEEEKVPETYNKTLESIKSVAPAVEMKQENKPGAAEVKKASPEELEKRKQEAEARFKARQEFVRASLQKMIDNLQSKLESKGLMGLLTPKKEVEDQMKKLGGLQRQGRDGANWEQLRNSYTASLVDKRLVKELIQETREQFPGKELEAFEGDDKVKAQMQRGLTDVSAG